jgi:Ammonia permease
MISGAVAGLGTITPASGFRRALARHHHRYQQLAWCASGPAPGSSIGFNYDDSLDVFGVHGVGGMTGTCWPACSPPAPSAGPPA